MENYIVRIYRRDGSDPHKVAGVFESVEQESENTFTHLDCLISLLATEGAERDFVDVEPPAKVRQTPADRIIKTDEE